MRHPQPIASENVNMKFAPRKPPKSWLAVGAFPDHGQRFVIGTDRGHIDQYAAPRLPGFQDAVRDEAVDGAAMDREEACGVLWRGREGVGIERPDGLDGSHGIAPEQRLGAACAEAPAFSNLNAYGSKAMRASLI